MENQEEIWEDIEDYKGVYQISCLGRLKSFKYGKTKILKPQLDKKGYYRIRLYLNGYTINTHAVHRLVAIAFIPNPENKPTVNHKKGIKTDNRASELEWATYSENNLHSYRELNRKRTCLNKLGKDHPRSKSVLQFAEDGNFINEHGSQREASRKTKIKQAGISAACLDKRKSAGGYIWKFKNDINV